VGEKWFLIQRGNYMKIKKAQRRSFFPPSLPLLPPSLPLLSYLVLAAGEGVEEGLHLLNGHIQAFLEGGEIQGLALGLEGEEEDGLEREGGREAGREGGR